MSRLIIKNVPSYVTPTRLKEHFCQKNAPSGIVTDVKVALKPDGTPRRFAFVGFKTEDEAKEAQQWFDNTFIDSTRIRVSIAEKGAKDAPAPRPNKKVKLDNVDRLPSTTSIGKTVRVDDKSNDSHLEKFLQVMQPRTKKDRSWQNDAEPHPEPQHQTGSTSTQNPDTSSPEDHVEEVDDLEWMKRRMAKGLQLADQFDAKAFIQDDEGEGQSEFLVNESQNHCEVEESDVPEHHGIILKTGRLFLRNLSYSCVDADLESLFSPFGPVNEVHVSFDPVTKTSKGFAYVRFSDPQSALEAYKTLDKTPFQGRLLHILPAVERQKPQSESVGKASLKSLKDKKRKDTANKEFNWSMLYMNSDAVASSIADRMNISKADILNPDETSVDNTSAAVKLALAETHIIQETKDYLESEGIDLSSFSSLASSNLAIRQRRSDTCILVKNIPYGTTAAQIRDLFEPHGELSRVLVPPAGTIAVVDFVHSDEAAKAFKAVAYRRMGPSIIYLEKAPIGIFNANPRDKVGATDAAPMRRDASSSKVGDTSNHPSELVQGEKEAAPGSTLFVKNLSFATSADRLTQVFRHLPGFAFARIQTKIDPKRPNQRLSMGYGFVGFNSPDSAKKALLSMHNFTLDGHSLTVKFAGRGTEEDAKAKESVSAKTTKMIVKNVPFEATKKDIRELFSAHGQLKSVRLPKRFDARSRGFAFLEFITRREAENAYATLRHTHLLGRHLVLEWATEEQNIEELRTKAGVGFGGGTELPGRKRKFELDDEDVGDEE